MTRVMLLDGTKVSRPVILHFWQRLSFTPILVSSYVIVSVFWPLCVLCILILALCTVRAYKVATHHLACLLLNTAVKVQAWEGYVILQRGGFMFRV